MTPPTEYNRWAFEAKHNGIPMATFKMRLNRFGWGGERAATQPVKSPTKNPDSLHGRLFALGIASGVYYRHKQYLDDIGAEYTQQDIFDICLNRRRG